MTNLRFLLPLLLLVMAGCSWFGDDDEEAFRPAELKDIEEQFEADILWSRSIGDGVGEYYNKLKPVVYDGKVVVADANGLVKAFDQTSGDLVWETEVGSEIFGGVAAATKLVALGSTEAEVIVLNSDTGEELWRNLVSSEVVSAPAISDGKVIARTIDGKLFAMDSRTGERDWIYDRTVPALTLRGTSSLTASRGAVVTGFANGKIALFLTENGRAVWEKRVASATGRSELDRVVDIDATPIFVGDTIYAVTFNGNIAAFDVRSGEAKWQREMSSFQDVTVSGQLLSVVDARSKVRALDRRTGGTLWTNDDLFDRRLTAAEPVGDYFVAADFEGYLHWFDRTNGRIVSRNSLDSDGIVANPVAVDSTLFVYSRSGRLYAIKAP